MKLRGVIQVRIGDREFRGESLSEVYGDILAFLVDGGYMSKLELPIRTSSIRYILARRPIHQRGNRFVQPVEYKGYYLESHKARDQGLVALERFVLKPCKLKMTILNEGVETPTKHTGTRVTRPKLFVSDSKPSVPTAERTFVQSPIRPYNKDETVTAPTKFDYKTHLDALFANVDVLMWELSEETGYFTNYEFIRRAAQQHQGAYVRLLATVLEHRGESYLFNIAHENIGSRLSDAAKNLGYQKEKQTDVYDTNIWGDHTAAVVYRRTETVRAPY